MHLVLIGGQLQGGSSAVVGAADQVAEVYVDATTAKQDGPRAREAITTRTHNSDSEPPWAVNLEDGDRNESAKVLT